MQLEFFHVDAFSDKPFQGNPAAVFVLQSWLPEAVMQAIAAEFNLSETAFSVLEGDHYHIRWFTPATEVPLCGHATLASSHVLHQHLAHEGDTVQYQSLSGNLCTKYDNGSYTLDFPANPPSPVAPPNKLEDLLGTPFKETLGFEDKLIVVLENEKAVANIAPDLHAMAQLDYRAVCVTGHASSATLDFVCRFFAPAIGIDEDPVTGSAYTMLAPYYASLDAQTQFYARQLSPRGGDVGVEICGDRVLISGKAHTVMHGNYFLHDDTNERVLNEE